MPTYYGLQIKALKNSVFLILVLFAKNRSNSQFLFTILMTCQNSCL